MRKGWGRILLSWICSASLALAPVVVRAEEVAGPLEPGAEKTIEACQDKADNDGDGKTDCKDPDCGVFAFCEDVLAPKSRWEVPIGVGSTLILGAIAMGMGSIPLWADATDWAQPALNHHLSGMDGLDLVGAAILTAASIGFLAGGTVLLVRGLRRHERWKKTRVRTVSGLQPWIGASTSAQSVGLGGSW